MSNLTSVCSEMLSCLERPQRPPKELIERARSLLNQEEKEDNYQTINKLFELFHKCPTTVNELEEYLEGMGWTLDYPSNYGARTFKGSDCEYYWNAYIVLGWDGELQVCDVKSETVASLGSPVVTIRPEVSSSLLESYTQVGISLDAFVKGSAFTISCTYHLCDLGENLGSVIQSLHSAWRGLQNSPSP